MHHPNDLGTLLVTVLPWFVLMYLSMDIACSILSWQYLVRAFHIVFSFSQYAWTYSFPWRMDCFCSEHDCLGVMLETPEGNGCHCFDVSHVFIGYLVCIV